MIDKKYLIYGLIACATIACSKDSPTDPLPDPLPEPVTILAENVNTVTSSELEKITQITDSTITFSDAMDYSRGDILVGGISANSPNGFLRKIKEIDGGNISTSKATIEDVITKGNFHFEKELKFSDLENSVKTKLKSGVSNGKEFHYSIDDLVIYDLDKDPLTMDDQVILRGDIYFDASATVDVEFNRGLKKFYFGTTIEAETELEVESRLNIPEIDKKIIVYEQACAPISIPSPFLFPIIFQPRFQIYAGVQGNFEGKVVTKINASAKLENELLYENKYWDLNTNFTKNFEFKIPEVSLKTDIKAYGGPRLDLVVYGALGPYVNLENYLKLNVDTEKNPWWKLSGGVESKVGVDMGIFSKFIPNYEKIIYEHEEVIGQAMNSKPPTVNFDATPIIGEAPLMVEFDLSKSTSGEKIKNYLFDFGNGDIYNESIDLNDGAFDGKTKYIYDKSGIYWAKGKVEDELGRINKDSLEIKVLGGWQDIEFGSDDGSDETSFGLSGKCKSWWQSEDYRTRKTITPNKYPFKLEKLKFYFESPETSGGDFRVEIKSPQNRSRTILISSNDLKFPGWHTQSLNDPVLINEGSIYLEMYDPTLPKNCSRDPLIHGWKIGVDESQRGNSSLYYHQWDPPYVYHGTNSIRGELMIRAIGKVK